MRAIATFITGLALCLTLAACQKAPANAVTSDDMSLGSPTAKVTVIEYASLGCPHCATWNNEVYPLFKTKYIDTGRVHYVLREALTGASSISAAGFLTARCVGKDRYFQVVDAAFAAMPDPETVDQPRPILLRIAQSAGLSEAQFSACVSDEKSLNALEARWNRYMNDDKVNATPTFVINGKSYAKGVMPLADLDAAITEAEAAPAKPAS